MDLKAQTAQHKLSPAELQAGLAAYLNQGSEPPTARLAALFQQWGLKAAPGAVLYTEADLRGDGQREVVAVAKGEHPILGPGAVFVIDKQAGRWQVDRTQRDDLPGVQLYGVVPLPGEKRQAIVWSSTGLAANSPPSRYFFSTWKPGQLTALPGSGDPYMVYGQLTLRGSDVVLHGGMMGSAGSGAAQRPRTDTWHWDGSAFKLTDRRYDRRDEAYFRLEDGIVAEQFNRLDEAKQAYQDALDPQRAVGPDSFFLASQPADPAQLKERLAQAVRSFARFRLGRLLLQEGVTAGGLHAVAAGDSGPFADLPALLLQPDQRNEACAAAQAWAEAHPEFLDALNSPFGFGKVTWKATDLCGPLPIPFLDGPNPPR